MRPDGSQVRQLTHISPPYQAGDPNWSPDGAQIAYVSDTVTRHFQVWVMNANGGHQHRLVDDPGYDAFLPRWSPDSTRLLFTRCTTVFNTYECAIVQVRADGTHLQPLTDGHHLDSSASWAPDLGIVFDSNRSNALSAIWRTTAAGPQRITPRSAEASGPITATTARASSTPTTAAARTAGCTRCARTAPTTAPSPPAASGSLTGRRAHLLRRRHQLQPGPDGCERRGPQPGDDRRHRPTRHLRLGATLREHHSEGTADAHSATRAAQFAPPSPRR